MISSGNFFSPYISPHLSWTLRRLPICFLPTFTTGRLLPPASNSNSTSTSHLLHNPSTSLRPSTFPPLLPLPQLRSSPPSLRRSSIHPTSPLHSLGSSASSSTDARSSHSSSIPSNFRPRTATYLLQFSVPQGRSSSLSHRFSLVAAASAVAFNHYGGRFAIYATDSSSCGSYRDELLGSGGYDLRCGESDGLVGEEERSDAHSGGES